jgi:hypothetical protein
MATYDELLTASANDALRQRILVACVITANTIILEAPATANHAARLAWARATIADPNAARNQVLWSALAQNKAATLAQITGASDASLQTAVDAAVAGLAV